MFLVTIVFGTAHPIVWSLQYRDEEKAKAAYATLNERNGKGDVELIDDFTQQCNIRRDMIYGVMIEDMQISLQGHAERALHEAKTRERATKLIEADPGLRMHSARGGPAAFSPMGPGFTPMR